MFTNDCCRVHLSKGIQSKASVPTDDLIHMLRHCRNHHSLVFQVPIANTDICKYSFFPQTIRDWNALPDSLISSAEGAKNGVAKLNSLVRATCRDYYGLLISPVLVLVSDCRFDVSPANNCSCSYRYISGRVKSYLSNTYRTLNSHSFLSLFFDGRRLMG